MSNDLNYAIYIIDLNGKNEPSLQNIYQIEAAAQKAADDLCKMNDKKNEWDIDHKHIKVDDVAVEVVTAYTSDKRPVYQCNIVPINENIIIFGYSELGVDLKYYLEKDAPNLNIIYCDNSVQKQKNGIVYSIEEVVETYPHGLFFIASLYHAEQMKNQLIKLNVNGKRINMRLPDEIVSEARRKEAVFRSHPNNKFRFEVNINKHCNLKCKGCDHFAPLAKEDLMDINDFEKDLECLSNLFEKKAWQVHLLGGEPLLNPNLLHYIDITRKCFPASKIFIDTNGILLEEMSDDFWCECKRLGAGIMLTKYPINVDYDALCELAVSHGVECNYLGSSEAGRTLWHFPLDLEGKQDPAKSFMNCRNANACLTLESGRLYTCSIAPNIKAFNDYFKQHVNLTDEDGIDIYGAQSAEEVLQAMSKPMPFCRYCDVKHRTYDHPWEVSKKSIKEWTL